MVRFSIQKFVKLGRKSFWHQISSKTLQSMTLKISSRFLTTKPRNKSNWDWALKTPTRRLVLKKRKSVATCLSKNWKSTDPKLEHWSWNRKSSSNTLNERSCFLSRCCEEGSATRSLKTIARLRKRSKLQQKTLGNKTENTRFRNWFHKSLMSRNTISRSGWAQAET